MGHAQNVGGVAVTSSSVSRDNQLDQRNRVRIRRLGSASSMVRTLEMTSGCTGVPVAVVGRYGVGVDSDARAVEP